MTPLLLQTATKWKIPRELALAVIARDIRCIYCGREFGEPQGPAAAWPSWEHIVNDVSIITVWNIALCCHRCNSSKRNKSLKVWLSGEYCKDRNISEKSIAAIAIAALGESS